MAGNWTLEEKNFLKTNLALPVPVLAERLSKTEQGVRMSIHRRGLAARKKKHEVEYIIQNYHGKTIEELAKELGRTVCYTEELLALPELKDNREVLRGVNLSTDKTIEDIITKEDMEFRKSYMQKIKELSKVELHKKCKVIKSMAKGEKEDRRKAGNALEGQFTEEYRDFYLFETEGGYKETFLKIDLVIGSRKVKYI